MEQTNFSLIKMISEYIPSLILKQPDRDTCYNKPLQIDSN